MSLSVFNMTANKGLIFPKTIGEGHKRAEMNLRGIVAAISWRRKSGLGGSSAEFCPIVLHHGVLENPATGALESQYRSHSGRRLLHLYANDLVL